MEHQNPRVKSVGHQTIMPYLLVNGALDFIEFAREVFGMELQLLTPRSEGIVKHAELRSEGSTVMVADTPEGFSERPAGLFIYVNDTDETYENALDHGATSIMEPNDQNYGRGAGVLDRWGNTWWITKIPTDVLS